MASFTQKADFLGVKENLTQKKILKTKTSKTSYEFNFYFFILTL